MSDRENTENNPPDESLLTEEILKFLGDNPKVSKAIEPKLHKDISDRLEGWIIDGLPKEDQEKLIKKYSRPEFLEAPKLNPEVEPVMQEAAIKRDKHFLEGQNIIGSAITSAGSALSLILAAEEEDLDELVVIERLSDTIRLLADLFNKQTTCRRAFILPGLKPKLKAAFEKTKSEGLLFGKELSEKIKQVGVMEKMAKTLKEQPPKKQNNFFPKNWKGHPGRTWNNTQSYRQNQWKRRFFKKKTQYQNRAPQNSNTKSTTANEKKTA
ncbi:PREDICTED: uncharacterized protein LOC105569443 [Vollenhovia emeryi]|uniref:uncharacterized protein LOC105569443 n=1 Tax=Vollenhovia emeryi TaxID=411798 RepID=UPI0005F366A1|nr:PREDICTED: uncharacterized protein LOC105569443 [Vollenhovia emeryi]